MEEKGIPRLSKRKATRRLGIGVAVVLVLGIVLVVTLGDVVFLIASIGIGIAVGAGMLIGTVLCEALNRHNR